MANTATNTLPELQAELRHHLLVLAVLLNDFYGPHALRAVLGATTSTDSDDTVMARVDTSRLRLGALLPEAYDYAFHGKLTETIAGELNDAPSYFDIVSDFVGILEHNALAEAVWNDVPRETEFTLGGLRQMTELAQARYALDEGQPLDARKLAVLAGMTDRSVQNAFSLKGPQGLQGKRVQGHIEVSNVEARRWLNDRRAFVATTKVSFPSDAERPTRLETGAELRAYLRKLVNEQFADIGAAAARIGVPTEELQTRLSGAHQVDVADACGYAQALGMDEGWFLLQVMQLNHPHEVDVLKAALQRPC